MLRSTLTPLFVLAGALCAHADGPARRALLVGVGAYPAGTSWPALRGPRTDVEELRRALLAHGFRDAEVHVLRDEEATRERIAAGFAELVARSGPGDLLLFYFAGHGSQLPDDNGDETLDGWDETLVPYDALDALGRPNDLRDDELERWIGEANRRTDQVVLVFDCCSSGTNTRGGEGGLAGTRFLDPAARGLAGKRRSLASSGGERGSGWAPPALRCVTLSACRAQESAYEAEVEGQGPRGLFTLELVRALGAARADWSYADLLLSAGLSIAQRTQRQTPLVEGTLADRRLFSDLPARGAPRFELARDARGVWQLEAGLLSGLGPDALLCAAPLDAARAPEVALGRLRVSALGAQRSVVEWLGGGAPAGASARCSAFVLEPGRALERLGFAFAGARDERLAAELSAAGTLAERPGGAAFLVLEALDTGLGVALRGGKALPLRVQPGDDRSRARFVRALTHLARAWNVPRLLASPAHAGELAFEALDCDAEGASAGPLAPDPRGGWRCRPGRHLAFRIRNLSGSTLHPLVLIVSPDGEVAQFFAPTIDGALPPGGETVTPVSASALAIGAGFDEFYAALPMRACCLLTSRPVDLALLEQPALELAADPRGEADESRPDLEGQAWLSAGLDLWLDPSR